MTDATLIVVKPTNPIFKKSNTQMPPVNQGVLTEICEGMSMSAGDIVSVPYLIQAFAKLELEVISTIPEGLVTAVRTTRFLVEEVE